MRFDIISVIPELLESPLNHSIMQRAKDKGLLEVFLHNLRDYALGKHRQVDDYQFGGGAGMVMRPEPFTPSAVFASPRSAGLGDCDG